MKLKEDVIKRLRDRMVTMYDINGNPVLVLEAKHIEAVADETAGDRCIMIRIYGKGETERVRFDCYEVGTLECIGIFEYYLFGMKQERYAHRHQGRAVMYHQVCAAANRYPGATVDEIKKLLEKELTAE